MTDRELLNKAAKAAGIAVHRGSGWQSEMLFVSLTDANGIVTGREWNPLADDGDALRLATKCRIGVLHRSSGVEAHAFRNRLIICNEEAPEGADYNAATRRAIVRAAAALGDAT